MPTHSSRPIVLAAGLTREYLIHHRVCPRAYADNDTTLLVAAAPDALLESCLDDLECAYLARIQIDEQPWADVEAMIERLCSSVERAIELARGDAGDSWAAEGSTTADVRDLATQPPVVRFVNLLVRDAYDAGASDIHLEATPNGLAVRFRLDGVLSPAPEPPAALGHAVVSRIKLLAELDIAERRRPQDGRIRVRLESRELDLRVSTVPTIYGESVVLRLLDRGGRPVELEELGMPAPVLRSVLALTSRPHGLVLVTGPTGSGKTTTLYACLQRRSAGAEKIITVEDPVEYQLPGVSQVPVHSQAGVTFSSALRSILRQDPDVVMVGEMRDPETAEIAIQAAMTGHLVLSTLHTNDAVAAVPRLLDLESPPYLVAATLEGVLAQRLVRRICDACRTSYRPAAEYVRAVADDDEVSTALAGYSRQHITFARGAGCPACRGTGFRGRVGLYELLVITDAVKDAIARNAPRADLRRAASQAGLRPLRGDGWDKIVAGITTVEEVLRVVQQ
jgi:general secretion pathway protein E